MKSDKRPPIQFDEGSMVFQKSLHEEIRKRKHTACKELQRWPEYKLMTAMNIEKRRLIQPAKDLVIL
jgi:hypothetical protein